MSEVPLCRQDRVQRKVVTGCTGRKKDATSSWRRVTEAIAPDTLAARSACAAFEKSTAFFTVASLSNAACKRSFVFSQQS